MFKHLKTSIILLLLFPITIFAYSDYIIPGGENIGIEINTNGVVVVGTYDVNGKNNALISGIKVGDIITNVNGKEINSINELISVIDKSDNLKLTLKRKDNEYITNLQVTKENGITKTGLYVKDSITGIGTLSYIDPETSIYGALGHEVIESNTGLLLEVKDGKIVESNVTNIERSTLGNPGSKNASLDDTKVKGDILKNTTSGIFGNYSDKLPNKEKYKVADYSNIKKGKAKILTVLDNNEIKEYEINILKINKKGDKNILFEITDQELLDKTGGVIQGMSGSPIIQDEFIIGAVTHVVVEDPKKGYGIYIVNMLEEGERR